MNSFFDGILSVSTTIQLLTKLYEKGITSWHEKELKADFDTNNSTPILKTPSPMEKQAANLYTRRIFMKFQAELVETLANPATKIDDSGTTTTYRVSKFGEEHKAHTAEKKVSTAKTKKFGETHLTNLANGNLDMHAGDENQVAPTDSLKNEKEKRIHELTAELDSINQRCEVYRSNLLAVLKDMEEQKLKLSVKVQNARLSLKDFSFFDISNILKLLDFQDNIDTV
nr:protein FAR1-RELATED SEQUENCE 9 [Ipomoea batatas]